MKLYYFILAVVMAVFLTSCIFSSNNGDDEDMPGKRTDRSDKNAPKVIKSKDITLFDTYFVYDRGTEHFNARKMDDRSVEITKGTRDDDKIIVGPEFLVNLQEIIDKHGLATWNGDYSVTAGLPDEPTSFLCKYESGESIYFHKNATPGSEWMRDVVKLFLSEFPGQDIASLSGIVRFAYWQSGMAKPDIYSFTIDQYDGRYILRAEFFDPESPDESAELVWETDEYRDAIKTFYGRAVEIYDTRDIRSWDGFDKTNRSVRDGHMFNIVIEFENGESISAYGNNAFPPGFEIVKYELKDLMDEIIAMYQKHKDAG